MPHSVDMHHSHKADRISIFLAIATAVLLNQTSIIFGINLSFADFFCLLLLLVLIMRRQLALPFAHTLYFLLLSVCVLFTAVFFVPAAFSYESTAKTLVIEYTKLLQVFIYFIIGYNLSRNDLIQKALNGYSTGAAVVGAVGILFVVLGIGFLSNILFYYFRFRGFMNDPNYFGLLQVSATVYFSRMKNIKPLYKKAVLLVLCVSIILTGSKTAMVTLLGYSVVRVIEYLVLKKKSANVLGMQLLAFTFCITGFLLLFSSGTLNLFTSSLSRGIPSIARVSQIFTDFDSAIQENGSGRDVAWSGGLEIIKMSPVIGIGIGTYSGIALKFFDIDCLSHSTYLQLFAEWGSVFAFIFFAYIFFMLFKFTFTAKQVSTSGIILRDMMIVFLIGSGAISLNNARMFWFFLGALLYESANAASKVIDKKR